MSQRGELVVADLLSKIEQSRATPGDTPGERSEKSGAGIVEGHPYLANDAVAFVWAKPEEGPGLISIYDRRRGREFLATDATSAPLWQVMVKTESEQRTYRSAGMPCTVSTETHQGVGKVTLRWAEPLAVQVEAQLAEADSQVRMTIAVQTPQPDEGLLTVTFPVVSGILPLTREGRDDKLLQTRRLGRTEPSPAVTGKTMKLGYPGCYPGGTCGMTVQFTESHHSAWSETEDELAVSRPSYYVGCWFQRLFRHSGRRS